MSIVRFATICDRCGSKSPEYLGHTLVCSDCERDVCEKCCETYDPDPPGAALCKDCHVWRCYDSLPSHAWDIDEGMDEDTLLRKAALSRGQP